MCDNNMVLLVFTPTSSSVCNANGFRAGLNYRLRVKRPLLKTTHIQIQDKINSKRKPGRWRISWLANLRLEFGKPSAQTNPTTKIRIDMMTANIRNGQSVREGGEDSKLSSEKSLSCLRLWPKNKYNFFSSPIKSLKRHMPCGAIITNRENNAYIQ